MINSPLAQARTVAAAFFEKRGDTAQARIVLSGGGDDFLEVQVALQAQAPLRAELDRFRRALSNYADASFWEADIPEATLAFYDRGESARFALAGRDLFETHRD